jgi:hypothetical protein
MIEREDVGLGTFDFGVLLLRRLIFGSTWRQSCVFAFFSVDQCSSTGLILLVHHLKDSFDILALGIGQSATFDRFKDFLDISPTHGIPIDTSFADTLFENSKSLNEAFKGAS